MSHAAFSLLAEPIQRILWDLRWEELRPIQRRAIRHVLEGESDLVIAAATAGGKTEAAFLPVLSRVHEDPGRSVRALYVGPLKALINDQFRRLETLCEHAGIPVHRWHGDVGEGPKRRLVERPAGVLLITPESIESLLINRREHLPRLFADLEYVVIDEIHAFMGTERGTHLRSLLSRLARHSTRPIRHVGLSATLGDMQQTALWFGPERADRVAGIRDDGDQKRILYRIEAAAAPEQNTDEATTTDPSPRASAKDGTQDDGEPRALTSERHLARRMLEHFIGSTNLVFANARTSVELFADLLNEEARANGLPAAFLVHHGSLSREHREQVEAEMQSGRPTTCLCSSTLELGIDVGSVKSVGQIGPPWSVASLVQRLGRSGRREGEPAVMRVYLSETRSNAESPLPNQLHPGLLRTIALTELMLCKWVEPSDPHPFDLSTLLQQVLSVIVETGGVTAAELYRRLVTEGVFQHIEQHVLLEVLRAAGDHDLIEQAPDGTLILGLEGERVVKRYDFYSAFATPETFQVLWQSRRIGELPVLFLPDTDEHLLLAGRRWQVVQLDTERKAILVKPAHGLRPPCFVGVPGEIHPRVRQVMRSVVTGDASYAYLDDEARTLLEHAREAACEAELDRRDIVSIGSRRCYWFTWTGTRIQRTLQAMCKRAGLDVRDCDICLDFNHSEGEVAAAVAECARVPHDPLRLAETLPQQCFRKYDEYLSSKLQLRSAAENLLDIEGAVEHVRRSEHDIPTRSQQRTDLSGT